jgi:hypothetical protein
MAEENMEEGNPNNNSKKDSKDTKDNYCKVLVSNNKGSIKS